MCGIFGLWHRDGRPIDLALVQRATALLRHRGPDDEGYLLANTTTGRTVTCGGADTDPVLGLPPIETVSGEHFDLAFGFRRLAILDLSTAGHQPMASEDEQRWIIYNGEVYNYRELAAALAARGHRFRSASDTEVILAAYAEWGPACLEQFNGMWAFALWDGQRKDLFLARDRFGVKPLHFLDDGTRFAFASEIKALVGQQGVPFAPDDEAIYRYLAAGILPSPQAGRTFFRGVEALPAGRWMRIDREQRTVQRFWSLPDASTPTPAASAGVAPRQANPDEAVEGYRSLLTDSVRLRLRSDVAVGTCLSGGLDSTAIVCTIGRLMKQDAASTLPVGKRQQTFSAVYETEGRYNERTHIEKVLAGTATTGHFTIPTFERLRVEAERLIWHQDEPFGSTSIFAQWCVMSLVQQQGVTVLLDGQGADEALAGYRPFVQFLADRLRSAGPAATLADARAIGQQTGMAVPPLLLAALRVRLAGSWADGLRHRLASRHRDDLRSSALNPEFAAAFAHQTVQDWAPWRAHHTLDSHLRTEIEESSLPHLLRYEDRNSMAFSVEARVPYLDYRLVTYSLGAAAAWRIHDGWTKWVLRKATSDLMPDEIAWRRDKVGFETPESEWMRLWLASEPDFWREELLSSAYLDARAVQRRLSAWYHGGAEGDVRQFWRWYNLELWLRLWRNG